MPKVIKNKGNQSQKGASLLRLVLAGLLVFLLGGSLVAWYYTGGDVSGVLNREDHIRPQPTSTLQLDTLIVNLADPGGHRFLKVNIVMEYPENKDLTEELEEKKAEITDLIITVLRSKTVDEIKPLDKVAPLKNEIIETVNNKLDNGKVSRVFFTEFIIQ